MSTATDIHPDYLELVRRFPLRPIRTKHDHDRAMRMIRELAIADEGTLGPGAQDYLDTLTLLLEENDRHEDDQGAQVSGRELLQFLMEANDMTVSDLGQVIGSQPNASLILSGKRDMSKAVMLKLGERFGVDPGLFFR